MVIYFRALKAFWSVHFHELTSLWLYTVGIFGVAALNESFRFDRLSGCSMLRVTVTLKDKLTFTSWTSWMSVLTLQKEKERRLSKDWPITHICALTALYLFQMLITHRVHIHRNFVLVLITPIYVARPFNCEQGNYDGSMNMTNNCI